MTFVNVFSKYGQAYPLRDATALSILQALLTFSTHHGIPLTIVTITGQNSRTKCSLSSLEFIKSDTTGPLNAIRAYPYPTPSKEKRAHSKFNAICNHSL